MSRPLSNECRVNHLWIDTSPTILLPFPSLHCEFEIEVLLSQIFFCQVRLHVLTCSHSCLLLTIWCLLLTILFLTFISWCLAHNLVPHAHNLMHHTHNLAYHAHNIVSYAYNLGSCSQSCRLPKNIFREMRQDEIVSARQNKVECFYTL